MLTFKQATNLQNRIEREGASLHVAAAGTIAETGPHKTKPNTDVIGHHYTVVVADTRTGDRVEVPAKIANYPEFVAWWQSR